MELFEAMETCRAMRYLKPDPVPQDMLDRVIHAATRASNPGNSQRWGFVVVRDPDQKQRIQQAVAAAVRDMTEMATAAAEANPDAIDPMNRRILLGAGHLLENLHLAPVIVIVCAHNDYPPGSPPQIEYVYSTVYPASQNLILAARALGLGTVFTTFNLSCEAELRQILELPEDVHMGTLIPMGFPEKAFGPVRRRPTREVIHYERWDPSP